MKTYSNACFAKLIIGMTLLLSVIYGVSAQAQESKTANISEAELEQILAPIALYPDTILSHILIASTYPLEVVQAERWLLQHSDLYGQNAVEKAAENGWDPSVQALVAFPQIIKRMSQDLNWTKRLGDAFLYSEEQVLSSIQNLRELAQTAGSLDEMSKVTVSRDEDSIVIEPREREIVYLPYYDTRVVYGSWRWPHYQPTVWGYPYVGGRYSNDYYARNRHRSFYWGPSISLSFGFFSNSFHWRNRHLIRISSRNYQPRRYYSQREILSHRHAQRWVHNANRRHSIRLSNRNGNRNIHRQNNRRAESLTVRRDNVQRSQNRRQVQLNQERVRNRLLNQRTSATRNNSTRTVVTQRNRQVVTRNGSVNRSAPNRASSRSNTSANNSRVTLPRRVERRTNNQAQANRATARQNTRPPSVSQNNRSSRPATVVQQKPASRPVQQQQSNRAATTRKSVAMPRNERRKPR